LLVGVGTMGGGGEKKGDEGGGGQVGVRVFTVPRTHVERFRMPGGGNVRNAKKKEGGRRSLKPLRLVIERGGCYGCYVKKWGKVTEQGIGEKKSEAVR